MTLQLIANGQPISGWSDATITRSILTATNSWEISYQGIEPTALDMGNRVEWKFNGETLLRGYVETRTFGDGVSDKRRTRGGRSLTADAVDSSAALAKGSVINSTITQIVEQLLDPYDIEIQAVVPADETIRRYRVEPGERIIDAIRRLADTRALLVWTDDDGALVLSQASNGPPVGVLDARADLTSTSGRIDLTQRYRSYVVLGQAHANDQWDELDARAAKGSAIDNVFELPRERRLVIVARKQVSADRAQVQADWERQTRAGKSFTYSAESRSLTPPNSDRPWTPNTIWTVNDPDNGLTNLRLLLTDVTLRSAPDGDSASLTFASPLAYSGAALPPANDGVF